MTFSDALNDAATITGITAVPLDETMRAALHACLKDTTGHSLRFRLWESGKSGVNLPEGWRILTAYVGSTSCILHDETFSQAWHLPDGEALQNLLTEMPPAEFYVCDEGGTYLLCHNHHDYLIGWGAAETWVESLRRND